MELDKHYYLKHIQEVISQENTMKRTQTTHSIKV